MAYTLSQVYALNIIIVIGVKWVTYKVKKFGDHRERRTYAKTKNAIDKRLKKAVSQLGNEEGGIVLEDRKSVV